MKVRLSLLFALLLALTTVAVPATGQDQPRLSPDQRPTTVRTATEGVESRIHPRLTEQIEAGSTRRVAVFVSVEGDPAEVNEILDDVHIARGNGAALVVGTTSVQNLTKLAASDGVLAVGPIELRQTASPPGIPDPELAPQPDAAALQSHMSELRTREVPYDDAPPPAGSNFEELKDLGVLDAKTHDFAGAWDLGYTGEGSTVAVLDGGTDWGHPDMLGTWRTGPDGWPLAYDPYGTLLWLVAPSSIDSGLSWYTRTVEKTDFFQTGRDRRQGMVSVEFDTRTGPARNFSAPDGFVTHTYRFPKEWADSGAIRMGSHPDDHLLALYGERPAFIATDLDSDGSYETIYVDLDGDYRFDDEKPVTQDSPVSYRDMDGDGFTDLSGGLIYHISDGVTPLPGGPTAFGLEIVEGPGELIAWSGDFDPSIGGHGTLTASNVVGQGVINGLAPEFDDIGTYPGAVIGGAPHAKLAPFGDIYFSFAFSTQFGYFLANSSEGATGVAIDATSNSYGSSAVDNDGFDAASQEADLWNLAFGGKTTALFSTGNGAPGFGTTAPPSPYTAVSVGASTQFGGTGWDSIANISQVVDNDVMVWSNRGFGATGANGVDVVADGAFSAGDVTLNSVLDGSVAWTTWGGTSRSAPVAAGATALIYQAYRGANGSLPDNFMLTAGEILASSANDLGYESTIQGGGSVDAAQAVRVAGSSGGASVSPGEWRVGDYRGDEWDVFTHVVAPGGSDSQTFSVDGSGTYEVSDRQMVRTDTVSVPFATEDISGESDYNFNVPDYLIDISDEVAAHPDADLMVVRANFSYDQFDPNADYAADQLWRLLTYNWTDVDGDGLLWRDRNRNGVVNHRQGNRSSNIDGFLDINYRASEIDEGEYVRFMYHRAFANTLQNFVRSPSERMADGLFIGLQHNVASEDIPITDFEIQIDFYENHDWDWVASGGSASGDGSFDATVSVPTDAPYGMYSGAVVLTNTADPDDTIVVPVSVAVAPEATQDADGHLSSAITFGGSDVAEAQADLLYNNGSVFGATDWSWRPESGDWRFYFFDVAAEPAEGALLLVDTQWQDAAPFTDIDTLVFGPSENQFQLAGSSAIGAPYILDTVAGSPNTNVGAGVWIFDTATGGPRDLVTAPLAEGLHAVVAHQVNFEGDQFHTPFEVTVAGALVDPSAVEVTTDVDTGSFDVVFQAGLELADGLTADAFGLSQPSVTTETAQQDDPADPSSASVKVPLTLSHASRLSVTTALGTDDLDLFVVHDADGDGAFTTGEIVGASTTGSSNEFVELGLPADGDYEIWVQGWSVAGSPEFTLSIDAIQGTDLTVSGLPDGALAADTPVTVTVTFDKAMVEGETYHGELLLGPPAAPGAVSVPITIIREAAGGE